MLLRRVCYACGDGFGLAFMDSLSGGVVGAVFFVMLIMFIMAFFLAFIASTFVEIPIIAKILLLMDLHPVWLAIMIATSLQSSFLTPPFGFALFYLRGVAPDSVTTAQVYRGVIPFVGIQILALIILATFPWLVTWLPDRLYGS